VGECLDIVIADSCDINIQLIRFLLGNRFGNPTDGNGEGTWKSMNIHQQVFMISIFSNMIRAEQNTLQNLEVSARQKITYAVSSVGWQVVWGPVVWKNDPDNITGPDHVWFVAKKFDRDEHIYM